MKTVIMAGGKGTRISSVASDIPKPMIKIEGKPVLEHELECLRDQGFTDIILTVSHLGNIIMDYFGDGSGVSPATGKPFGVHIEYYFEKEPLGNAGALFKIKDRLDSDFLLLNADAVFDVDFNRFVAFHKQHGGLVTLFTHPNSHPYDSGLIIADKNGSAIKSAMAELGPNEVTNRTKIEPLAQQKLAESLNQKYGEGAVFINKVVINNMDFEEAYNTAIQQKSIAQQNADKQKIENEAAIAKAEADKQVAITNAEAEAQKTSIAADAQAEANRKIAESLSDTLIEYQKIQKWDGKLPTVSGSNALVSIDPAE